MSSDELKIKLSGLVFYPVIDLPESYPVFDFSKGYNAVENSKNTYGVGRYDEHRPTMYQGEQYQLVGEEPRTVHMGVDIAAPVGTEVRAFYAGEVLFLQDNKREWDYGPTLVTSHRILSLKGDEVELFALFGHLSRETLGQLSLGQKFETGDVLGWIGSSNVNGGWNPHLHFQLSTVKPDQGDMPGVVSQSDRKSALNQYPDPRLVLGAIY